MGRKISIKTKDYIRQNYLLMSSRVLSNKLGVSRSFVQTFMKSNNLIVPKETIEKFRIDALKGRTTFSESQTQFIIDNYLTMPVKTMASKIGRSGCGVRGRMNQLGLIVPKEIIEQRKKESRFKGGQTPKNKGKKQVEYMSKEAIERTKKTRFKKGSIPHNFKGGTHLTKEGYVMASLGEGRKKLKHIVEWEKINGKIPKSYCLKCKDENKLNTDPSNWKLISRVENMYNNSVQNYPKEIIPSLVLVNKINKKLNNLKDG